MGSRLRVVVADDDDGARECVRQWLIQLGHDVVAVGGGGALVGACRDAPPDLVISDVGMPDLDGITAAGMIRSRLAIPVILFSARWDDETTDRAVAAGATKCLTKPVRPLELVAAIEAVRPNGRAAGQAAPPDAAADARWTALLATAAHELRNHLTPLAAQSRLLQMRGDPAAAASGEVIHRHVRQMAGLIDDLLDAARACRGKVRLARRRIDARDVVARAAEAARPALDAGRHDLAVAVPADPLWLDADPDRLDQVLVNLLTNAAKYTPDGGRVEVAAERDAGEVVLRVRDNGVGIPADRIESVFELFAQVEGSLPRSRGGLGIGLALARELVGLHGGTVRAASDGDGRGSEFVVRLPAGA